MTAFPRTTEKTGAPSLNGPRLVFSLGHLFSPLLTYGVLYQGWGGTVTKKYLKCDPVTDLSPARKHFYQALDAVYSTRWAVGGLIMQGTINWAAAILIPLAHALVHELPFMLGSITTGNAPAKVGTKRDYLAAACMILGGILQHGSELQRWWFKRQPSNKGKLHTGGLFGMARGINHAGHVLRDVGHLILAPTWPSFLMFGYFDYDLLVNIFPSTAEHCRTKYGEAYADYEKATPSMYIPGIW